MALRPLVGMLHVAAVADLTTARLRELVEDIAATWRGRQQAPA